ncbi:MAG TPA: response regulator [Polyangia bacterium]|jgi:FixJ family two-component response regulator|nr:response regulator [Polyangia bacterium]
MTDAPVSPTVYVVDDDASVRRSIKRTLEAAGYEVAVFASPLEFLDRVRPDRPDCLVLDLRMPGMTGLELQELLGGRGGPLPIVFMSGHGDVPSAVQAMKAGALDFLPKPFDDTLLLAAVERAIAHGWAIRDERVAREAAHARFATLSPQEQRVCRLVAQGLLNKQIASELDLAEQTVRVHRGHVMKKLEVESVAELVRLLARIEDV